MTLETAQGSVGTLARRALTHVLEAGELKLRGELLGVVDETVAPDMHERVEHLTAAVVAGMRDLVQKAGVIASGNDRVAVLIERDDLAQVGGSEAQHPSWDQDSVQLSQQPCPGALSYGTEAVDRYCMTVRRRKKWPHRMRCSVKLLIGGSCGYWPSSKYKLRGVGRN